jgi:hypothetical protein
MGLSLPDSDDPYYLDGTTQADSGSEDGITYETGPTDESYVGEDNSDVKVVGGP